MKRFISNRKLILVVALCAITIFAVTAYAVTQVRLAQGTIASSEQFNGGPALVTDTKITLQPGDAIRIGISGIGFLENAVVQV